MRKIISRHRYTTTVAALLVLIILGFGYFSFDSYRTMKKEQKKQAVTKQWASAEGAKKLVFTRQMLFTFFLRAWHEGQNSEVQFAASGLTEDSKEKMAAEFLLNPASLAEKEADFRRALSDRYTWFADFIVGEYHYKNGDHKKALEAYRHCYEAIKQLIQQGQSGIEKSVYVRQLVARLRQLGAVDRSVVENEN